MTKSFEVCGIRASFCDLDFVVRASAPAQVFIEGGVILAAGDTTVATYLVLFCLIDLVLSKLVDFPAFAL